MNDIETTTSAPCTCTLKPCVHDSSPVPEVKMGRPTIYTKELADRICAGIAEGNSLKSVLAMSEDMPSYSTVFEWLRTYNDFSDNYERSTRERTLAMGEEILDIADDGSNDYMTITKGDNDYNVEDREVTNRSKLRVETRKWIMSKMLPKKYGDKLDVVSDGKAIAGFNFIRNDGDNNTDNKTD